MYLLNFKAVNTRFLHPVFSYIGIPSEMPLILQGKGDKMSTHAHLPLTKQNRTLLFPRFNKKSHSVFILLYSNITFSFSFHHSHSTIFCVSSSDTSFRKTTVRSAVIPYVTFWFIILNDLQQTLPKACHCFVE